MRALRDDYTISQSEKDKQLADLNGQMEGAREKMRNTAADMNPALRVPMPSRTGERITPDAITKYQNRYGDFSQAAQAAWAAGFAPPRPTRKGDVATPVIGELYLDTNGGDHNKALAAAQKDGYSKFADVAHNPKTGELIYSTDGNHWLPLRPGKPQQQPAQPQQQPQ
jgi:hypothetical protein